jgi:hypothetical protein
MFVFLLANLPLPVIIYFNILVTLKFIRVRRLSRHTPVERPERLIIGWWLGNISSIFALTPAIWERRIFVQNKWWLVSYMIAATLSITGLILMNSGLGQELKELARTGQLTRKRKRPSTRTISVRRRFTK